jgi:hypothetical protein
MSEVKVNKISPRSGTDVTLGDSGDTITYLLVQHWIPLIQYGNFTRWNSY